MVEPDSAEPHLENHAQRAPGESPVAAAERRSDTLRLR